MQIGDSPGPRIGPNDPHFPTCQKPAAAPSLPEVPGIGDSGTRTVPASGHVRSLRHRLKAAGILLRKGLRISTTHGSGQVPLCVPDRHKKRGRGVSPLCRSWEPLSGSCPAPRPSPARMAGHNRDRQLLYPDETTSFEAPKFAKSIKSCLPFIDIPRHRPGFQRQRYYFLDDLFDFPKTLSQDNDYMPHRREGDSAKFVCCHTAGLYPFCRTKKRHLSRRLKDALLQEVLKNLYPFHGTEKIATFMTRRVASPPQHIDFNVALRYYSEVPKRPI